MDADLVIAALNMRGSSANPGGVIHLGDQGSQHTSLAFGERRRQIKVRHSMGTVGDNYDKAMAESFIASQKGELIERSSFPCKGSGPHCGSH